MGWHLAATTIPADRDLYQHQIEQLDTRIDALVCKLYGLMEKEVKVVEGRNH